MSSFVALGAPKANPSELSSAHLSSMEIDRIEISGATLLDHGEAESALELAPGDRLDRVRVVHTAERFQQLYRAKGYEEVSVRSELSRQKSGDGGLDNVLTFVIREGKPTRVASIHLITERGQEKDFQSLWNKMQITLQSRLGLSTGEVFSQERLNSGKRAIQDFLASEEYVGARISGIQIRKTEHPPSDPSLNEKTARWVDLELKVDPGDRVIFGFEGNSIFPKPALLAMIDEVRVVGFGKDYVTDIKSKIESEYRSKGYSHVSIKTHTFENNRAKERKIIFGIKEGTRVSIDALDFDGSSFFSQGDLRSEFYDRASVLIQNKIYVEQDVSKAAEALAQWLRSKGYLSAKLIAVQPAFYADKSKVRLLVYLYEGDQTLVQSVNFEGANALSSQEMREILKISPGEPLNLFAFDEGLVALKARYRARGYLDVKILNEGTDTVVRYTQENRLADIKLEVVEGPLFRVSRIEIEGLSSTRSFIVEREFQFKENEILYESYLIETEIRLRRLGIFPE